VKTLTLTRQDPKPYTLVALGRFRSTTAHLANQLVQLWHLYDALTHVKWLNTKEGGEVAMTFQQWDDEEETETRWWYSYVALLIEVPVYSERNLDS
jgi:hypothetical protein